MAQAQIPNSFSAKLHRPAGVDKAESWIFLRVPTEASERLPARSMVSVEGTFHKVSFQATLEPDGQGSHWLRVPQDLQERAGVKPGDVVELEITPVQVEPEPVVPTDIQRALEQAPPKAMETWKSTTALARRDWIFWITSGKKAETRIKRIEVAISKMSAGSRRPCCFDRAGIVSKSLSWPAAADEQE